jgi:hypothetical protein
MMTVAPMVGSDRRDLLQHQGSRVRVRRTEIEVGVAGRWSSSRAAMVMVVAQNSAWGAALRSPMVDRGVGEGRGVLQGWVPHMRGQRVREGTGGLLMAPVRLGKVEGGSRKGGVSGVCHTEESG